MNKKVQKGGENSTNIQVENINISQGITYSEAHKIAWRRIPFKFSKTFKGSYRSCSGKGRKNNKKISYAIA